VFSKAHFDGLTVRIGRKSDNPSITRDVSGEVVQQALLEIMREAPLKYGLIPEFVGRLPALATLEDLDEPTLKRILVEPKNALVKQYHRLFEMESIDLSFAEEALRASPRKPSSVKPGRAASARSWKVLRCGVWPFVNRAVYLTPPPPTYSVRA
jgi:ATP-dependent protease Clp ATPase subunit